MASAQPRRFIHQADRDAFGKAVKLRWLKSFGTPAQRSAAYRQHVLAFNVRQARKANRWSVEAMAGVAGVHPETLRRKLRGEQFMSMEDESLLALLFQGRQIIPDTDDLEPAVS